MASPNTNGSAPTVTEGGDAFDIGFKLRHRLNEAKSQKERTQGKINTLSEQLQRMFARAPKKPKDSAGQMDEKISKLEYTRTSVSLSLSDEKQLLRQIDTIKRSKKVLQDSHQHEVAIQEKKSEISSLKDHLRTVMASIAELESALAKVELARRLGCDTAELQTRVVDCPSDKIGQIIGKNGSALKQLENRTGVQIDVDKVGKKIHLQGSISALDAAVREVENITLAIEEEVKLTSGVIGYLIAKKSAILNKLQASHPFVHFDVSRNSTILRLRGKPDYVAIAKVDVNTLDIKTVTRDLLSKETGLVVGKGGATITKLVDDFDVSINVSDALDKTGGALLEVTGPYKQVDSAMDAIEGILHENEEMEDFIFVDPMQRNMFLTNGGVVLKGIQKEISSHLTKNGGGGILLLFERKDGENKFNKSEPSKLIIKCSRANIDLAKRIIERKIKEHEDTVTTITVDTSMISAIIGKGGAQIKELRKDGVEIEVIRETGVVKIQSENEALKASVITGIEQIVAENQVLQVRVEQAMIGIMFGDVGKNLRKTLTEDLGVKMSVDNADEHIIFRGTNEKINEANVVLRDFIAMNFTLEIKVPQEDIQMLLGGKQSFLSRLGTKHQVKANVRRGRNLVSIRGVKENVESAISELKYFIHGGNGTAVLKLKVHESALGLIIGKGGAHIAKLEKDFEGVSLDVQRSSNQLSVRGPENNVKKCRAHVVSLLATSKVIEVINISPKEYEALLKNTDLFNRIACDIDVQISLTENKVKIKGVSADVKDAKTRILECVSGKFETSVDLESSQFDAISKASRDPSQFDRIEQITKASLSLDEVSNSIIISGKRANVKKAKGHVFALLEFLCPAQFERVKVSKPVLKSISKPALFGKISAQTGAWIFLDRELNCILIRSNDGEEVKNAKALLGVKITESEKLNVVIRLDPTEIWLIPKIIGKDGTTVREIENDSGCKIEVSKAESTIAILGQNPEMTVLGKNAVDRVIDQARKENVFISIPDSAMTAFIGKGGENVRKISSKNRVQIERLKKDMSTIRIHGNENSVQTAAQSIHKWLKDWETANKGIKINVEEYILRQILGKLNAVQKDTCTKIDVNRRENNLTIRGGNDATRNDAMKMIRAMIEMNEEKDIQIGRNETTAIPTNTKQLEGPNIDNTQKPQNYYEETPTAKANTAAMKKGKKSSEDASKVAPHASQASQSLFNLLVSDPAKDCDNSTISSNEIGHEDDSTNERVVPGTKSKVYKSTSGFSVRV